MEKVFDLSGKSAVVTGASSGIGRAVALALASRGVRLCLIGRNAERLSEAAAEAGKFTEASGFQADLSRAETIVPLLNHLKNSAVNQLDILVHSAGIIRQHSLNHAPVEDFDLQYATNVRAPYDLTQQLLPLLTAARGQVVFINSSVALSSKRPEVAQYAATRHALKSIADSLREELNPKGVRVLTMYLGRTATPMQEALYREAGKPYQPECLLQPEDVAAMVVYSLSLPRTAEVTDMSMRPAIKTY